MLGLPTARVRAAARRAVAVADPDEVVERAERARAGRFVLVRPGLDPGMSEWVAAQPAEVSAAAWAAVEELAHAYVADGEHRCLDQARADAMIDLILGQATITTTLDLSIPLSALPGSRRWHRPARRRGRRPRPPRRRRHRRSQRRRRPDPGTSSARAAAAGVRRGAGCSCGGCSCGGGPGGVVLQLPRVGIEAARVGLIPTEALTRLLTDPDTRFRAVLHDPDTGGLLAVDARVYRPGEATARFVRRRDGTCRFPGCATPADRSDIDHVTTFATGGDTSPPNLITLCRRHHRLKHHGGWTLTMTPTGIATWTNGIGQQYQTHPLDHRHLAA